MIVTVSRQLGSDGETIARSVAATLGLVVLDREIIWAMALKAGLPADLLQRLMYEGQRNVADEIIQGFGNVTPDVAVTAAGNPLLGVYAPPVSVDTVSLQDAAREIGRIIKDLALRGNVLVLGQGGQALLQGQPAACHVLFVAPLDARVANVARWHNLSPREARRRVRQRGRITERVPGALSQRALARSAAVSSHHQYRPGSGRRRSRPADARRARRGPGRGSRRCGRAKPRRLTLA